MKYRLTAIEQFAVTFLTKKHALRGTQSLCDTLCLGNSSQPLESGSKTVLMSSLNSACNARGSEHTLLRQKENYTINSGHYKPGFESLGLALAVVWCLYRKFWLELISIGKLSFQVDLLRMMIFCFQRRRKTMYTAVQEEQLLSESIPALYVNYLDQQISMIYFINLIHFKDKNYSPENSHPPLNLKKYIF